MNKNAISEHDLIAASFFRNNNDIHLNKLLLFENAGGLFNEKNNAEKGKVKQVEEYCTSSQNEDKTYTNEELYHKDTFHEEPEVKENEKKQNAENDDIINKLKKKETNEIVTFLDLSKKCKSDVSTTLELSKTESVSNEGVFLYIHNIICSANLGTHLDLRLISISVRNAEYNPQKANTLIMRLSKPNCTALIFQTGRIMLTGTQTMNDAIYGCKKVGKIIKKVTNKPIIFQNFKIENMIATADCNMPVRLELLAHDHKEYCNYEPELFAGLIFRHNPTGQHKSVILVFVSGKMVISGCKSVRKLNTVFQDVYNVLKAYSS